MALNNLPAPVTYAEFKERIRCLCAIIGCSETSGMRTDKRNESVGGHPNSRHRIARGGLATDLVPEDPEDMDTLVEYGERLGITIIDEGDHGHAQPSLY